MKQKLTRRLVALLLLCSVLLPGCTSSTAAQPTGNPSIIALLANTARLLYPPSLSMKNLCVSWNS